MIKINNKNIIIILILALIVPVIFFIKNNNKKDSSIKIGVLLHLTGQYAPHGIAARDGINLFIEELNQSGGINGKKVECIEYDDEGDPARAVIGYNFLKDQNVSGIITGVITAPALAVVNEAKNDKIPIIVTTASADSITHDNGQTYDNVFRIGFTDSQQGITMAKFAKIKGYKNLAVLFCEEDDYSSDLKSSFVKECELLGLNVSAIENFSSNSVDFHAQLENIKSKNPDFIFVPSYYGTVGLIVSQARSLGIQCTIAGADSWIGVTKYVPDVSVLNNCFYCSPYSLNDPSNQAVRFKKKHREKYNDTDPTQCSATAYDAADVLTSAIGRPGNIIDNLNNTDIQGVTGNITFDEFHNPKKQAIIIQIIDGKEQFYQKI